MKKIVLLALTLFIYFPSTSQGILFLPDTSWNKILVKAKESCKSIFVDVYADWCGPCKRMDKELFTLKEVGEKFNKEFINYKSNAEKGEGPVLKNRYHVVTYPTYLFVRDDGTLIYKANGAMSPQRLLQEANNALSEANEPITILEMDRRYPSHQGDKGFMYTYIKRRTRLGIENADLLDQYFKLLNEKEQGMISNLQLVVDNGSFLNRSLQIGPAFEALLKNKDKFHLLKTNIYNKDLAAIKEVAMDKTLAKAIEKKNKRLLDEVLRLNGNQDIFNNNDIVKLRYFWGTQEYGQYIRQAICYVDGSLMTFSDSTLDRMDKQEYDRIIPGIDSSLAEKGYMSRREKESIRYSYKRTQTIQLTNRLFEVCRNVIQVVNNRDTIQLCLPWIKRCVYLARRDTGYFRNVYPLYLDMYACYLYQLNKKEKAVKTEQRAADLIKNVTGNKIPKKYATRLLWMKNNKPLYFQD